MCPNVEVVWEPTQETISNSNIGKSMAELNLNDYRQFHKWSAINRESFWDHSIRKLGIVFKKRPEKIMDMKDALNVEWLPGAEMNIVDSCFKANQDKTAIVFKNNDKLDKVSYGDLEKLTNRVANSLVEHGFLPGNNIAINMPMTVECVAIYLGIIKAGCAVVSIADSLPANQINTRLGISNPKVIFTIDHYDWSGKRIDIFSKVKHARSPQAIVITSDKSILRENDILWNDFLSTNSKFESVSRKPHDTTNILFSSGTTGEPKAVPWTHATPIKCAADGYFHQDIQQKDIVAWPTNIGWMMGPWLIYAGLINKATIALFYGAPFGSKFGKFVQDAGVSMLGLIPSIVKKWRQSRSMEKCDWSSVKVFSSTGECSNVDDYLYLMSLAKNKAPVIEYLGGTEVVGHITGTVVQPASPATFTTPTLGTDFVILNREGKEVVEGETGELFIIPPALGLSRTLLNRNHDEIYYRGCPPGPGGERLRRHGDEIGLLGGGFYQSHGRIDDTMNLNGIKISSIALERTINQHESVYESAAIAVQPDGPDRLVVYAVLSKSIENNTLMDELQKLVKTQLNPFFRIHDIVIIDSLPRTASNKVMRRELRAEYIKAHDIH